MPFPLKPLVGMFVYKPYEPNNPGKIKVVLPNGDVEVAWYDGKISVLNEWLASHLNNFNNLIASHQKKLNTHASKLPKLQAL